MKTTAEQFTAYGNISLVQIKVEPLSDFSFRPGAAELQTGGLVISESTGEGVVGWLKAENKTKSFLLLTDADVLSGAKQNRILNKSVLLAPLSETIINVSCIERLRWEYTEKNFSAPGSLADPDLRKEKAISGLMNKGNMHETQSRVWSHVSKKIRENKLQDSTESYLNLLSSRMEETSGRLPECEPEKGCTGLAFLLDKKVISIDLFGNEDVYRYYFPHLKDSAFSMAVKGKGVKKTDVHEAKFKALDAIDTFMAAGKLSDESYNGAGLSYLVESKDYVGYELTYESQIVHSVMFGT